MAYDRAKSLFFETFFFWDRVQELFTFFSLSFNSPFGEVRCNKFGESCLILSRGSKLGEQHFALCRNLKVTE